MRIRRFFASIAVVVALVFGVATAAGASVNYHNTPDWHCGGYSTVNYVNNRPHAGWATVPGQWCSTILALYTTNGHAYYGSGTVPNIDRYGAYGEIIRSAYFSICSDQGACQAWYQYP